MSVLINLVGQKFGRLTVLSRVRLVGANQTSWLCHCDCGAEKIIQGGNLKNGTIVSCGCFRKETLHANRRGLTHGGSGSSTYLSWKSMLQRCNNKNSRPYKDYGARGITVCPRWLSFEAFLYDMGHKSAGLCLERINNNEGYSPKNCKWATRVEQQNNRRNTRHVELHGRKLTVAQAARVLKTTYNTLYGRTTRGTLLER